MHFLLVIACDCFVDAAAPYSVETFSVAADVRSNPDVGSCIRHRAAVPSLDLPSPNHARTLHAIARNDRTMDRSRRIGGKDNAANRSRNTPKKMYHDGRRRRALDITPKR
ncbi:hypothetical protein [Bradyrhizobium prioriisuperbiae]|uniref:hypothetical protein n=1 Tax=Bradyrhizobium prioriisuperbiae TaxID=2854389 RepID=UPI0028EA8813|nr:hypothetical protein [Bradyrhizobium prioritasuperba]